MSESKLYCGAEIVRDGVPSFCTNAPNACRWHKKPVKRAPQMTFVARERCGAPAYVNVEPGRTCANFADTCPKHRGWRTKKLLADKLRIASTPTLLTESAVPVRPEPNTVDHPRHYNVGKIEAITVIEDWQRGWPSDLAFHLGNAIKYIARAGKKDDIVQDLKKARWYVDRALSVMESRDEAGR
jgi:hypothetical protein